MIAERRGAPRYERAHRVVLDAMLLAVDLGRPAERTGAEERVDVAVHDPGDVGVAEYDVQVAVDDLVRRDVDVGEELRLTVIVAARVGWSRVGEGEDGEHGCQDRRQAAVHERRRSGRRGRMTATT